MFNFRNIRWLRKIWGSPGPDGADGDQREPNEVVQHGHRALGILARIMGWSLLAFVALAINTPDVFLRTVAICSLTAAAFAFLGGLLGFLFGIPKSVRTGEEPKLSETVESAATTQARPEPARFTHNTNLEDISDWLTKILVGVGLTQLTELPREIWKIATKIGAGLGTGDHTQLLAFAIICFYSITGFLIVYLWTTLYLKGALRQADGLSLARQVEKRVSLLQAQSSKDANALELVGLHLRPGTDSPQVDIDELKDAIQKASSAVKTTIYNQAWEIRSKNWKTDKERMALTIPLFEALAESDLNNRYHQNHGQLGWALKDKEPPDWAAAEEALSRAILIRGDWRRNGWLFYEANRALCRIMMSETAEHSPNISKEDILADLRVAFELPDQHNFTLREPSVVKWMKTEGITAEEMRS